MIRGAGTLLHITSLPSPYGIGTFGKEAIQFVNFLEAAGQKYWQILPLGQTGFGDSPYQCFSAFAGNPYLIDIDTLVDEGLLTAQECSTMDWGNNPESVDYGALWRNRYKLLRLAFSRSGHISEEQDWLDDYCLFMALKAHFGNVSWIQWPDDVRYRKSDAIERLRNELADEIEFQRFCQHHFFKQWGNVKTYANQKGVSIIGDIPLYVAYDSADVWTHPDMFLLDEGLMPTKVAGVPPDMFSATGQLWGNPIYDWNRMKKTGFLWWKRRITASAKIYDVIRIDHFIGAVNYYSIPAEDRTAENGKWVKGPGEALISAVCKSLEGGRIIVEDLGRVTSDVIKLRDRFGLPGMRLLQMGYDGDIVKNCAVYGGTHDNDTLAGFFADNPYAARTLIGEGYASRADLVVFQMQDYLGLGSEARMNTPARLGGNWQWRLKNGQLTQELAKEMKWLVDRYGR